MDTETAREIVRWALSIGVGAILTMLGILLIDRLQQKQHKFKEFHVKSIFANMIVSSCVSCGMRHETLEFTYIHPPVQIGNISYDLMSHCPTTGEAIYARFDGALARKENPHE